MNGMMNGRVRAAALTAVAAVVLGACGKGDGEAKAEAAATPAATIVSKENIVVVAVGEVVDGPAISGALAAENQATVRAEVGGAVLQTLAEPGQRVSKGTLLARIDDTAIRQSFLGARSALSAAQVNADLSARELGRAEKLLQAGAVADRDLEGARSRNVAAQAQLADARARLAAAQKQLDYTTVEAPLTGVVSARQVSAGDVVNPGAAMFTVVQPSSMRLEASVPAEQLAHVKVGDPVRFTVNGYGDRAFTGKVTRVNPIADSATRQVRIFASIPNTGSLVGGLFAEGRVASESRQGLVLPLSAVDQTGLAPAVTRVKGGKAEKVTVALGLRDAAAETVEIRDGIAAGDTVLLGAAQGISANTPVRVGTITDQPAARP